MTLARVSPVRVVPHLEEEGPVEGCDEEGGRHGDVAQDPRGLLHGRQAGKGKDKKWAAGL